MKMNWYFDGFYEKILIFDQICTNEAFLVSKISSFSFYKNVFLIILNLNGYDVSKNHQVF